VIRDHVSQLIKYESDAVLSCKTNDSGLLVKRFSHD